MNAVIISAQTVMNQILWPIQRERNTMEPAATMVITLLT